MTGEPRIEQAWVFERRGQRAIGAVVSADMRRAGLDTDERPWRALVRVYNPDGELVERWIGCSTRAEAFAALVRERHTFWTARDSWTPMRVPA
jgi:hypothetical protein